MNHKDFMLNVVESYGAYKSKILERLTYEYVKNQFKEDELDGIFNTIIIKVNPKFKTPPSPADFNEIFFSKSDADYQAEAIEWYKKINRCSGSDNVLISDIRVQLCVESFGGWSDFHNRLVADETWHQKNFVDRFVMYSKVRSERKPVVMLGHSNNPEKQTVFIGDKEQCEKLLQDKQSLQIVNNMIEGMICK